MQSLAISLVEAVANVVIGYGVAAWSLRKKDADKPVDCARAQPLAFGVPADKLGKSG
jgi:hypothetical protein